MLRKVFVIMLSLSFIVGCSNDSSPIDTASDRSIVIDLEQTIITFVEDPHDEMKNLLSVAYRIKNQSNESLGPLYVNYIVHGQALSSAVGFNEFSAYKKMGDTGIALEAGQVYQGGDNFQVSLDTSDLMEIQNDESHAIEMQVIDIATEDILASLMIHKIDLLSEN